MIDISDPNVLETLMGRPAADTLSKGECASYAGRRILVTGAGGSVGSELVRRIAACGPSRLTLVDQSEYNLFSIEREVSARWPAVRLEPVLGDVTRPRVIQTACASQPDVVFHAAAYKHVTMLERDVCSAIQANVLGTLVTAQAARTINARFVLISSDKAVNPRSVMGASKRLAELVTLAQMDAKFRPVIVRFGNVLGSSGSVLELMVKCVQQGQPIPVTHVDATRYFMTGGEAATLVLRADLLRMGGEICWLDMGRPIRIIDLANRLNTLAAQAGLAPAPVSIIGLRAGEKLDEELTVRGMKLSRTDHARIWIAHFAPVESEALRRAVRALRIDVSRGDGLSALANLCAAVPEYDPSDDARRAAGCATLSAPCSTEGEACRLVA